MHRLKAVFPAWSAGGAGCNPAHGRGFVRFPLPALYQKTLPGRGAKADAVRAEREALPSASKSVLSVGRKLPTWQTGWCVPSAAHPITGNATTKMGAARLRHSTVQASVTTPARSRPPSRADRSSSAHRAQLSPAGSAARRSLRTACSVRGAAHPPTRRCSILKAAPPLGPVPSGSA